MAEVLDSPQQQQEEGQSAEPEQQSGDYTGPKGNVDLPEALVNQLKDICRKMDMRELQPHIKKVARSQKARLFQRGIQYLRRESEGSNGTIYVPLDDKDVDADKMYVFNLYLGYEKSFVATFAQTPCGVRFEPNDPLESSDVEAARESEGADKLVTKLNDQKDLQKKVGRLAWTDGTVIFYSCLSTAGQKFGVDAEGQPRPYPMIEIGGDLEWKVPIASGEFDEWDYARQQREVSLTRAKSEYPEKADKLEGGVGTAKDNDFSRQARISTAEGMQVQSGDALAFIVTRSRYWLRPSAFFECSDKTLRSEMNDWFPKGARVCFIGETYVESADEAMDDHIVAMKAVDGEGYSTPGLGDTAIGPQETFNDLANLARIAFLRGVPHKYIDQGLIPPEAISEQKSEYGCWHSVQGRMGEPLEDSFYEEAPVQTPEALISYLDNMQGPLTQFLTGQQPALFGGEMGEAGKTSSGYQQALNQAMGLMGLVWVPFKKAWASVMEQCVSLIPDGYAPGTKLTTSAGAAAGSPLTINVDNLRGRFLCYPATDENFPESWTAQKVTYQNLIPMADKNPGLASILAHPDNLRLAKDLVGLPEMTIPGADSDEKQMAEIEQMEKQPPVPDPQAMQQLVASSAAQGRPPMPQEIQQVPQVSSVDIQKRDDDATELATCVRWLNSPTGQKAYRDNRQWYDNVSLHADQHEARIQQNKPSPQEKPPSTSINFKDLPPDGQQQLASQAGLQITPSAMPITQ